jgi:formylglycine-generating enzyme required for sulfatase activity
MTLVPIPGGRLLMGSLDGRRDERPLREVEIAPFRLASTQVSNEEFDAFVKATGRPEPPFRREPGFDDPRQPVVGVSWLDAREYCDFIGARLPSEAEWEWAARGGRIGARYPWGDETPRERYVDYGGLWSRGPEPVGRHASNDWGLFEMCENVHEWCAGWYDAEETRRASRGGSWRHQIKVSTCSARSSIPPEFRYADYGFRVASNVPRSVYPAAVDTSGDVGPART